MTKMKSSIFLSLLLINIFTFAQEVKVTKVTDKVSVFNLTNVSNCNIVAISSVEGIILIDTETSPMTMEIMKEAIQKEFPAKKFIYVINTHAHTHHCGGNAVFKDIPIIAHENIVEDMQWWFEVLADEEMKKKFADYFNNNIAGCEKAINDKDNRFDAESLKELISYWEKRRQEIENGFEIIIPKIRFSDRMKLHLEDMTMDLIYYGKGHSKSDILIHIPEEKVLISGAVIIPGLPSTHPKSEKEHEVAHWISVLKILNEKLNTIETIIPGHSGLLGKESVKLSYEYFSEMFNRIKDFKNQGLSLDEVKQNLSLSKGFSHFAQFKDLSNDEKDRHLENIEVFWNNIKN